tara:strand:+ start:9765 stop:10067 length:303 start_codon:yes stop_codon:yes gene_type:complete
MWVSSNGIPESAGETPKDGPDRLQNVRSRGIRMRDLQTFLDEHQIRQKDLAFITGCTTRSVFNWITGARPLPRSTELVLEALADGKIDEKWLAEKLAKHL